MPTCLSQSESLGSLDTYRFVLHLLTSIQLPIFAFGSYCILFKTPSAMKSVKFIMLCFHISSGLTDFLISFITVPWLLFPVLAGAPMGIVDFPRACLYGVTSGLALVAVSILTVFENRYFVLFGDETWWQWVRKPFLALNYLYALSYFLPSFLVVPDQDEAFASVTQKLPCQIDHSIENRTLFILTTDSMIPVYCVGIATTILTAEIISFFVILFLKIIFRSRTVISARTHEMQRKFVIALSLQTILPFTVIVIPASMTIAVIGFNYHNQAINNLVQCLLSTHGIASTIVMIGVHKPYREVITPGFRTHRVYSGDGNLQSVMKKT